VQRFVALDSFGTKPGNQRFESRLATVILVIERTWGPIALQHKFTAGANPPTSEEFEDLRLNGEFGS
jgi:hypothetical protein